MLVTCSGGSFIGALIANHVPINKIKQEFYTKTRRIKWFRIKLSKKGFFSQRNVRSIMGKLVPNIDIAETRIPMRIIATNLNKGELAIFKQGNLKEAVCASMAFPGIYDPIKINDDLYVDGGVLNAVPSDIARQENDNIVITINLDNNSNNETLDETNVFNIIHKSLYMPLLQKRGKIIKENSDIILEPFKTSEFNLRNWSDILRFHSVKKMEYFYQLGINEAKNKLKKIKEFIK